MHLNIDEEECVEAMELSVLKSEHEYPSNSHIFATMLSQVLSYLL
jgi:hypothetical protein